MMTIWGWICFICWSWNSNSNKDNICSDSKSNLSPILAQYSVFNKKVYWNEGLNFHYDLTRNGQELTQTSNFKQIFGKHKILIQCINSATSDLYTMKLSLAVKVMDTGAKSRI